MKQDFKIEHYPTIEIRKKKKEENTNLCIEKEDKRTIPNSN